MGVAWQMSNRELIFVKDMTTYHIKNTINCFKEDRIRELYFGRSKKQWLKIFKKELKSRADKSIALYEIY